MLLSLLQYYPKHGLAVFKVWKQDTAEVNHILGNFARLLMSFKSIWKSAKLFHCVKAILKAKSVKKYLIQNKAQRRKSHPASCH